VESDWAENKEDARSESRSTRHRANAQQQRGPFIHYCHCGKWASFGFNVNLRDGKEGTWRCFEHRSLRTEAAP
jgi:hypothetical protein